MLIRASAVVEVQEVQHDFKLSAHQSSLARQRLLGSVLYGTISYYGER